MKKIKKYIKRNIKVVIAFLLGGIIIGTGGVYAATAILSDDVSYDNSDSGLNSTTVKEAIDELYTKSKSISRCAEVSGNKVTFKVGDYVSMKPTSTSYTTDIDMTGYSSTQKINPSELNLWRVIRIYSDGRVDMVSEYASSVNVYFNGQTGYKNYIGYLNTIAHQYENSCYTVGSRHMGYDGTQTPYITDTSVLISTTVPRTSDTSSSNITSETEVKGLGDMGYKTDYNLVNIACGSLMANQVGKSTTTSYWLSSRYYHYASSTSWNFRNLSISASGDLYNYYLYYYENGSFNTHSYSRAIRPIVTLKSGIKAASGDGSSASPYVLP